MSDFSFWDIVRNLLTGLQWTLLLSLVAFIGGGVIGLLVMTMRISTKAFPRNVARTYIELFQGTPLLMQLFLVFFGIALLGVDISPWLAAGACMSMGSAMVIPRLRCWTRRPEPMTAPSPSGASLKVSAPLCSNCAPAAIGCGWSRKSPCRNSVRLTA